MNEKPLLQRLLVAAFILALSMWLIKQAVCLLLGVWQVLLIGLLVALVVTLIGIVAWRFWRNRRW
jgi:hypothetical protein